LTGLFSTEHLVALAAVTLSVVVAVVSARRRPGLWIEGGCRLLAFVLVAGELGWWAYLLSQGLRAFDLADALPLQLCDITVLAAALALWLRRPLLVELTYFWALAGSLLALLTPDLPQHFPSVLFFQYYVVHGGSVMAALVLVIGLRQPPRRLAAVRVAMITIGFAALVGLIDAVSGANYMYLKAKPPSPTPFDLLGAWPWYLAPAAVIGAVLFFVLDLPFRLRGRDGAGGDDGPEKELVPG
jgi:hypothetical integral membrane protein (TIGR02206 family)